MENELVLDQEVIVLEVNEENDAIEVDTSSIAEDEFTSADESEIDWSAL